MLCPQTPDALASESIPYFLPREEELPPQRVTGQAGAAVRAGARHSPSEPRLSRLNHPRRT